MEDPIEEIRISAFLTFCKIIEKNFDKTKEN